MPIRAGPANKSKPPLSFHCCNGAGNFELAAYPGLRVKDSYWRWPPRNLAGNTIDFFMRMLGLTFHDAMRQITGQ